MSLDCVQSIDNLNDNVSPLTPIQIFCLVKICFFTSYSV